MTTVMTSLTPLDEELKNIKTIMEPRYYQTGSVKNALKKDGPALINLPTGTGKSLVIYMLTQVKKYQKGIIIILGEHLEILDESKKTILMNKPDADVGTVGFGFHEWDHQILLCGIDTLIRPERIAILQKMNVSLIITDECHHAYTNKKDDGTNPEPSQYDRVFDACPKAKLIGLTATIDRADLRDITKVFEAPVYIKTIAECIEEDFLCDLRTFVFRTGVDLGNISVNNGDYSETQLQQAVNRKDRNELIVNRCLEPRYGGPDIPTVVFCSGKDHAYAQAEEFRKQGIPTEVITSDVSKAERKIIFEKFKTGEVKVICNIIVLSEGWDANVWRVVLACPTRSRPLYAQEIGRGTRKALGKPFCYILDFTDNTANHSLDPVCMSDLIGVPMAPGDSIKEALKTAREKPKSKSSEKKVEDKNNSLLDGNGQKLVGSELNIVSIPWKKDATTGAFKTDVDLSSIVVYPSNNGNYHIVMKMQATSSHAPKNIVVERNLPLAWATGIAENYAKKLQLKQHHILDPDAAWRKDPISPSQREYIIKLQRMTSDYKKIPDNWTKEEAGKRIDSLIRIKAEKDKNKPPRKSKKKNASV